MIKWKNGAWTLYKKVLFQVDVDGSGFLEFPEFCLMMHKKLQDTDTVSYLIKLFGLTLCKYMQIQRNVKKNQTAMLNPINDFILYNGIVHKKKHSRHGPPDYYWTSLIYLVPYIITNPISLRLCISLGPCGPKKCLMLPNHLIREIQCAHTTKRRE